MANKLTTKQTRWTPRLIRQLRGKRNLADLGALLGAPKNTVWGWEAGKARPNHSYAGRLSELARRERFLQDWKLVGSVTIVGDLETASVEIADLFRKSAERSVQDLSR